MTYYPTNINTFEMIFFLKAINTGFKYIYIYIIRPLYSYNIEFNNYFGKTFNWLKKN